MLYVIYLAVVPAGEETELVVGMKNDGTTLSAHLSYHSPFTWVHRGTFIFLLFNLQVNQA